MKKNTAILLFSVLALVSCRTSVLVSISKVQTEKNKFITSDLPEDKAINAVIEPYKTQLETKMNTKIAHTAVELNKTGANSKLGNLLADYTLQGAEDWGLKNGVTKIDAAVINIGGIRTIIPAGDILTKQIYEVMPFENELVIVQLKGSDLEALFDYYAKTEKNNPVAQLTIETKNHQIQKKLINGKPVDPQAMYAIATSDYLALGGDDMAFFAKGKMMSTGIKLRDLYLEKFKANPEVIAPNDVRLQFNP
ncbi:MAG: 5'-nucleotidase C-terminal domain-containing protein [Bacteroidetes bacterium]|nr:5'-nucleotidase C-terminal domain-containing protein [Bacteroidota bacterium]